MQVSSLLGKKLDQTQGFLEDGTRVPLSIISVLKNVVSQVKSTETEGYNAIQVGIGINKRPDKPTAGHIKRAGLTSAPRFLREIRSNEATDTTVGQEISAQEVFALGDIVDVTGTSKGKGFAGVVKRYRFHGGPKTHGQSDRHRARGSSGSGTTPGRVYKGKKMAGRMGSEQVTVKNLEVLDIADDGTIKVRGLVPGAKGALVMVKKVGKNKKFMPLWSEKTEEEVSQPEVVVVVEEIKTPEEEVTTAQDEVITPAESVETASNAVETAAETVEEVVEAEKNEESVDEEKEVHPVK